MKIISAIRLGDTHIAFNSEKGIQVHPIHNFILKEGPCGVKGTYSACGTKVSKRTFDVIMELLNEKMT